MFEKDSPSGPFADALGAFRLQDVERASDTDVMRAFAQLHQAGEAIEAERLRWLGEIERRGLHRSDGYVSTRTWLADRFRVASGTAKEHVEIAKALEEMPEVRSSFASGDVPSGAVRALARTREEHPQAFSEQEAALVEAATTRSLPELRRILEVWSEAVDADSGLDRAERLRNRRRLDLVPTPERMVKVHGELDPESGEVLLTAVRAFCDAEVRSGRAGHRTPGQLRADAVVDIAYRFLSDGDRPTVGSHRPHVNVTMPVETLRNLEEGRANDDPRPASADRSPIAELDHTGPVPRETALRLACDAWLRRVVLSARSVPLDVGRQTEVVPRGLRRAVVARDRGCRFPGCDRPPGWSDCHHVVHWSRGGKTSLDNLVLLCRPHHRLMHEGGFTLRMEEASPVFARPDSSPLEQVRAGPLHV